ncbi:response regulator transcription factor, partial [Bacteroides heparinolyticus]
RTDAPGSRFVIRIPLGAEHLRADEMEEGVSFALPLQMAASDGEYADEGDEKQLARPKSRQKVLVVEDEEEIRTYLQKELSDEYRVWTRCNGKEAYDSILKEMPDLVICDIMMPEMDGLTLCHKLKQNTNINHIPVILLTAKSRMEDTLEGMETGADAYIVKPFNTELLKSTIANLLTNRRLLRNKFSGAQQQEDKVDKLSMKSSDEVLMERIMKVVNKHLDDPELNVEMLASEVGLSRVHVHRKLKELTNLSTRDFIKNIRLQQAASLLAQDKKMTISEVAYAVGYSNLSHFSNSFKEKYGMSPKEYMNKPQ